MSDGCLVSLRVKRSQASTSAGMMSNGSIAVINGLQVHLEVLKAPRALECETLRRSAQPVIRCSGILIGLFNPSGVAPF